MKPEGDKTGTSLWSEVGAARGAEVLASYQVGPAGGSPAIAWHRFGSGHAWYLGTRAAGRVAAGNCWPTCWVPAA
jgi:beta-galactosidase